MLSDSSDGGEDEWEAMELLHSGKTEKNVVEVCGNPKLRIIINSEIPIFRCNLKERLWNCSIGRKIHWKNEMRKRRRNGQNGNMR